MIVHTNAKRALGFFGGGRTTPESVMAEVMVPHPRDKEVVLHFFADARNEKDLMPAFAVAESLRVP